MDFMKNNLQESEIIKPEYGTQVVKDFAVSKNLFSEETIKSLSSLGETLKKIRVRLLADGYVVERGKIYKKC